MTASDAFAVTRNATPANTVGEIAHLATAVAGSEEVMASGDDVANIYVVPAGYQLKTVDLEQIRAPYRDWPRRKTGTVHVETVSALLDYHAKHALPSAEIWVGRDGVVVDVLNAHDHGDPQWQDHRAILVLRHSVEWNRWAGSNGVSGKLLRQVEFAEFLEGAAVDVLSPDMATLLEVAQSLQATAKVEWKSAYRTTDGQRAFRYEETIAARAGQKGELEIPPALTLALRVFEGQEPQPVHARFRYRINGEDLFLGVVIDRIPDLIEQARADVAAEIRAADARGIVLVGSPE